MTKKQNKQPGWQKHRKRTPDNCISISDSWYKRVRKRNPDKVTVRVSPEEMTELIHDASGTGLSVPAYLLSSWRLAKIRPNKDMPELRNGNG